MFECSCLFCLSPARLSAVMLFGFKWCHTYSNHLPPLFVRAAFPISAHLSFWLPACLSAARSPQNVSHIKGTFLSALGTESLTTSHSSSQPLGKSWRAGCRKFSSPISPSFFHSSFISSASVPFPSFHPSSLLPSPFFLKNITLNISPGFPPLPFLPTPLYRPPTARSHSHSWYVSRKYYHTKLKEKDFFFFHLFSFHSTLHYLPSQPAY